MIKESKMPHFISHTPNIRPINHYYKYDKYG
ncbi:protein of unknown function [Latilactobacillus sakei]|nr:protein of unknown function [Latilactobacillus sakei]